MEVFNCPSMKSIPAICIAGIALVLSVVAGDTPQAFEIALDSGTLRLCDGVIYGDAVLASPTLASTNLIVGTTAKIQGLPGDQTVMTTNRGTCLKWPSFVIRSAPCSSAAAAIQMSFWGIGFPFARSSWKTFA